MDPVPLLFFISNQSNQKSKACIDNYRSAAAIFSYQHGFAFSY